MSIYENIGGASAVRAAVDDFYVRILADPNWHRSFRRSTCTSSSRINGDSSLPRPGRRAVRRT
ncbi:globin domain-containing protein [Nakamurella panacisegetis]|uniref:globin domain-containing protein n=1 Tax=Nakamurella panacisegetis TaxID=1090615 RepID=UPI0018D36D11